jgi:hypothetical protein
VGVFVNVLCVCLSKYDSVRGVRTCTCVSVGIVYMCVHRKGTAVFVLVCGT